MPPALPAGSEALPVSEALPALLGALAARSNAVLVAPPGAGKTTLVPLALLGAPWLGDGRIVMLEPRRLAARAAATRMAATLGEKAGETVGFRTRVESAVSARTRVEVVTEGILLRRLLADPTLDGVGCVVLDEVHERSLDADAAMAFCLDLQRQLRPELRILAMSATADARTLEARMGAAVVESAGRMHPVEVRHARRDLAGPREIPDAVARAVAAVLEAAGGDVLAFLPGVGEIRRAQAALAGLAGGGVEVLPLFGELAPGEQDRVLRPAGTGGRGRRVVLATSIAETSLTVPGVRIVVDAGWRRTPRLDPGSGLSRLETVRISRAAAAQRTGRAGREAPGLCVRLWTENAGRAMAPHDRPEILDAELSGFRLQAAAWQGTVGTAADALPLPDAPPNGAFEAAGELLRELGAVDAAGGITPDGERMAALGAHPRLAAMMLAARDDGERALGCELAALLEERDPLRPRTGGGGRGAEPPSDVAARLELLRDRAPFGAEVDRGAVARIRQAAALYRRRLGVDAAAAGDPAALIAAGFPDRVAQGRGEPGSFRLSGGGGARMGREDPLARRRLLAVAALHVKDAARITLAAALDPDSLPAALLRRTEEQVESVLDGSAGTVVSRRRRRLGTLVLSDRTTAADPEEAERLLAETAAGRLDAVLDWGERTKQLRARVAVLRELDGPDSPLPDLGDAALAAGVDAWLRPHLRGMTRLAALKELDTHAMLWALLPRAERNRLDRALPADAALPRRRAAIDYEGAVPTVSARAQDFYGMGSLPVLADGRVRLQAALLSPAGRPAAITADLGGFWRGGWLEVRRDLRGRYPKHDWPEDPSAAGG